MDPDAIPDRLRDIIIRAVADQQQSRPPDLPEPRPRAGQSRSDWAESVARARAQHDAFALENADRYGYLGDRGDAVGSVHYADIPVEGASIAGRIYQPSEAVGPRPAIVMLHGGGWWMGGGAQGYRLGDGLCRMLCRGLGAVVVNVDYRLAPEHPFPVQLHDVRDTVTWLRAGHGPLIDAGRVAVAGISSGGQVAAALAQLMRDSGEPGLALQLLIAPAVDLAGDFTTLIDDPVLAAGADRLRRYYVQDQPDLTIAALSPARAPDLTGLPPTVMVTGDFDPLTPPAVDYARRLREAGVPVEHLTVPATHTLAAAPDWRIAEDRILAACRRFMAPSPPSEQQEGASDAEDPAG